MTSTDAAANGNELTDAQFALADRIAALLDKLGEEMTIDRILTWVASGSTIANPGNEDMATRPTNADLVEALTYLVKHNYVAMRTEGYTSWYAARIPFTPLPYPAPLADGETVNVLYSRSGVITALRRSGADDDVVRQVYKVLGGPMGPFRLTTHHTPEGFFCKFSHNSVVAPELRKRTGQRTCPAECPDSDTELDPTPQD